MEKIIHDVETNEITIVELTKAEIDAKVALQEEETAKALEQANLLARKQAVYNKLGLSADEIETLLA